MITDQQYSDLEQRCKELELEIQKAGDLDALKNTFISTSSHQLRTPLTTLRWILSIFQSDPEIQKLPSQSRMIDQAFAGIDRIIDTVNDLTNVSRIQQGKLPFFLRETDVVKIVSDAVTSNLAVAASRNLTLQLDAKDISKTYNIDPILFREALENMLNNALDYSTSGSTVSVTLTLEDNNIIVGVKNQGIGVNSKESTMIGRPFFRGEQAILTHPDGSGLGLYLTTAITSAHQGSFILYDDTAGITIARATFSGLL